MNIPFWTKKESEPPISYDQRVSKFSNLDTLIETLEESRKSFARAFEQGYIMREDARHALMAEAILTLAVEIRELKNGMRS